jgi:hypothetical protein
MDMAPLKRKKEPEPDWSNFSILDYTRPPVFNSRGEPTFPAVGGARKMQTVKPKKRVSNKAPCEICRKKKYTYDELLLIDNPGSKYDGYYACPDCIYLYA